MYWTYVLKIPLTSFFVYEKFIFDYDKLEHYTRIIIYSNFNLRIRIFKNCLWYISLTAWKNVQFEGYYEFFFWLLWKWRNKKKNPSIIEQIWIDEWLIILLELISNPPRKNPNLLLLYWQGKTVMSCLHFHLF